MRLETGVRGLDVITRGGLLPGGIYLVVGRPGAGKSILGNQIAHAHVRRGGRAVYATLLSETHARLLGQVRQLAFFDETIVGAQLVYLNVLGALESGGLEGLLKALQKMVRDQNTDLLVLDGLVPPNQLGIDELAYKKFVATLQAWVGVIGCTVLILRTGAAEGTALAEQTMVDGILEMTVATRGMRTIRQLAVAKLRGTGFAEGKHTYIIGTGGVEVFPRIEAILEHELPGIQPVDETVASGTPGLDPLIGGALVRGSTTLLLGWSGSGKTIASLQFAYEGAKNGEPVLFVGLFEQPDALVAKAKRLGMDLAPLIAKGLFHLVWNMSAEAILDRTTQTIFDRVQEHGIRRVVVDGFAGLRTSDSPERVSQAFTVLLNDLSKRGVTTVVTDETRELEPRTVTAPTDHVSGLFHNLIVLRQIDRPESVARFISVLKTRDTDHDPRLFVVAIDSRGLRVAGPHG